jgi:hypothetical protein
MNTSSMINRCLYVSLNLLILGLFSQLAVAHGISDAEKLSIIEGGNLRYMWIGATHMLSGYDHLAFVFGIIFFLNSFKDIAKYVTAFTVGHSVTLIYATFNNIQLNYFLIDAVIALSVSYIAFSNIDGFRKYLNIAAPNMMTMVVALGLIHGFGLSTRLQELPLSQDQLLLNIISFNIGIELGQLAALFLMLVVLTAIKRSPVFSTFSLLTNYVLIAFGVFLFLMQMHGYEHSVNAEEYTHARNAQADSPTDATSTAPQTQWQDTIDITIPAQSFEEYKLFLQDKAMLEFTWQTDGQALYFDFHGEPEGDTSGYFESYKIDTQSQANGSLIAPFSGTHGWYWKNDSKQDVVITLKIKGTYLRLDMDEFEYDAYGTLHDTLD